MTEAHEPGSYLKTTLESQPRELARLLADDSAERAAARLRGCSRVFVVGTGTSLHGALAGQFMLRDAGVEAWAVRAFEFSHYPPALRDSDGLILLSHRGNKRFSRDSLDGFARSSDRWVVITGEGSAIEGEGVVHTVEQEKSPVHTASHTGAMVRLAQMALALGSPSWRSQLHEVPAAVGAALQVSGRIAADVAGIELRPVVQFVGGGPAHATALEGALKLREASHLISAEGQDVEGILHGPLVSIGAGQVVVLVAQYGLSLERTTEVARALKEIGAIVLAAGSAADDLAQVEGVSVAAGYQTPGVHEVLAPIVNVVPLQLLAYEASRLAGVDADSFRRDEKEYAAAQAEFTL